jgi:uncharacterized protein YndB with AHSA1/START domain
VQDIEIRAEIPAPPVAVWKVLEDHAGYAKWAGFHEVVVRQPGDPPPNGLGAIRVLRRSGVAIEEEIIGYEPPRRLEYALTAGLPVRDYRAEVVLEPAGLGTQLVWRARFRPLVPGTGGLLRRILARSLQSMVDALVRQAGAAPGVPPRYTPTPLPPPPEITR